MLAGRCAIFSLIVALSTPCAQAGKTAPLPSFTASYTIHNLTLKILDIGTYNAKLSTVDSVRFRYEAHSRPAGMLAWLYKDRIDEQSQWRIFKAAIRPLSYTYNRSGGSKQRLVELRFDWRRGTVENKVDGDSWRMPIPDGTIDKLTVQLAMMLDLGHGRNTMQYAVADGGTLKTYRFKVIGKERLVTPAGSYDTLKLERLRDNNKRSTYLWCAPKLHNLPVRVDQREEDDSKFSMVLTAYTEP